MIFSDEYLENLRNEIAIAYKKVMDQREEILRAFIAKYGCHPDEICQIEIRKSPIETVWYCELKDKKL